jgi:hypothetical protein
MNIPSGSGTYFWNSEKVRAAANLIKTIGNGKGERNVGGFVVSGGWAGEVETSMDGRSHHHTSV